MSNLIDANITEVVEVTEYKKANELLESGWKLLEVFVAQSAAPVTDGRPWYILGKNP